PKGVVFAPWPFAPSRPSPDARPRTWASAPSSPMPRDGGSSIATAPSTSSAPASASPSRARSTATSRHLVAGGHIARGVLVSHHQRDLCARLSGVRSGAPGRPRDYGVGWLGHFFSAYFQ